MLIDFEKIINYFSTLVNARSSDQKKNKFSQAYTIHRCIVSFSNERINFIPKRSYQNICLFLFFDLGDFAPILMLIAIIFSVTVIQHKNPIYSLFSLMVTFINVIAILLSKKIEFIALTGLIIYIGAISILFLFVIMMFDLKKLIASRITTNLVYSFGSAIIFLCLHVYISITKAIKTLLLSHTQNFEINMNIVSIFKYKMNDILIFSELLYSQCSGNFLLIGIILLTAMIGSIVLPMSTM